jgi:hypothetical protein
MASVMGWWAIGQMLSTHPAFLRMSLQTMRANTDVLLSQSAMLSTQTPTVSPDHPVLPSRL